MASKLRGIVVVLLSTMAAGAGAFTFTDGTIGTCTAAGRTVIEIGSPPGSAIHKLGYTGITSQAGSGYQITWNTEKLKTLPPVVHDFIFFHECAHARVPTTDELRANCEGLKDMRAAGRAGFAVESKLSAYFGVGSEYWAKTLKCANEDAAPPAAGNPASNPMVPRARTWPPPAPRVPVPTSPSRPFRRAAPATRCSDC
jgi:hypothetical protein